jgi:hypothetical protein
MQREEEEGLMNFDKDEMLGRWCCVLTHCMGAARGET